MKSILPTAELQFPLNDFPTGVQWFLANKEEISEHLNGRLYSQWHKHGDFMQSISSKHWLKRGIKHPWKQQLNEPHLFNCRRKSYESFKEKRAGGGTLLHVFLMRSWKLRFRMRKLITPSTLRIFIHLETEKLSSSPSAHTKRRGYYVKPEPSSSCTVSFVLQLTDVLWFSQTRRRSLGGGQEKKKRKEEKLSSYFTHHERCGSLQMDSSPVA